MSTPANTSANTAATAECVACKHADEHGWWGTDVPAEAHCGDCHRYWRSHREAHCAVCCRHFASNAAFDAHRIGDTCNDPATLTRQDGRGRFILREVRLGQTWSLVNYRELPDFDALG